MSIKIGLLFHPEVKLFHFSVPHLIFSDLLPEQKLFELFVLNTEPHRTGSLSLAFDGGLERALEMDILIVAGWHDIHEPPSDELQQALQTAYSRGKILVGLCYGTYALAYSGVLNGKKAATHWAGESDFARRFPQVKLDNNALYVDDENIITSAGTAASLDCCLYIVRKFYGSQIANKIARIMVVPPHREGSQAQFIDTPVPTKTSDRNINQLLAKIRENPTACYRIDDLAEQLAMSRRTFTRHFQKATGTSLTQWLIAERLQKSLTLLESTHLSIEQIAAEIGFQSAVSFREHFKAKYQVSPNQWRKTFGGVFRPPET
ncbi:GlxA family transcriptional regulator [Conservatibacter flavescens]|uniref:AraC family transcriptional regulator n=1 Tax=Conservatibacter flavescens TaxID=28161 RepID=A0A2M8S0W1_9PAST|nr:helix-turn-helix domain-containing protein [Conservatibacter flavescens]PJG84792.1 AraC family transcriptional regulator [Conservatibacter flavescens]